MHILTANKSLSVGPLTFLPGVPVLIEDVNAGEVMAISPEFSFSCQPAGDLPRHQNPQRILFIMPGGFGDLVLLTPVLRAAVEMVGPDGTVALACFSQASASVENLPFPLELHTYPMPVATIETFDLVLPTEGVVTLNHGRHPVDLFSESLGVEIPPTRRGAIYRVRDSERLEALENFPPTSRKRIGIQVRASALCRTYPAKLQMELIRQLIDKDYEVFLFGGPGECALMDSPPHLINLCLRTMTFRQSCAMLSTCHGVIAPDSSLCHVAGALSLPTVALYGPFPWQSRTIYHPSIYAINGHAHCAPCFYHKRAGIEWPEKGPCKIDNYCYALASISPERVIAKLEQQIATQSVSTNN